jgi:hypothetical protein
MPNDNSKLSRSYYENSAVVLTAEPPKARLIVLARNLIARRFSDPDERDMLFNMLGINEERLLWQMNNEGQLPPDRSPNIAPVESCGEGVPESTKESQ